MKNPNGLDTTPFTHVSARGLRSVSMYVIVAHRSASLDHDCLSHRRFGAPFILTSMHIVALSALLYCSSKMMERAQHITKIDLLDSSQGYLHVSLKGTVLYRVRKVEDHMADKIMTHGGHLRCGASPFNWCAC